MSDDDDQQRLLDADALEPRAAPRRRRLATAAAACVVGVALAVAVLVVLRYAGLLALDWQPPASAANATTPTVPPLTLTMQSATPQPTPGVPRPYVAFLHVSDVHLDEAYDPRFNASAHCHAANRGNRRSARLAATVRLRSSTRRARRWARPHAPPARSLCWRAATLRNFSPLANGMNMQ